MFLPCVLSCSVFSLFRHMHRKLNKSQLTQGNVSIDPVGTFTPDTLFTVEKRLLWLNWQINQQLKVTFSFSGSLSGPFTYLIFSMFSCSHSMPYRWSRIQRILNFCDISASISSTPCFLFLLYWHNIQKWPFPASPLSISLPLAFSEA